MKSNYNQLGQYIEMVSRTNSDLKYGIEDVRGCSNTKQMMQTRANLIGRTYEKFIVLRPQEFVFNRRTTRNGEKIGMAYNNTDREYIFTNDYVAFRVKQEYLDKLLPDYLYMFFCRDEFDRYARYKSTGSATEFFNWEDMCAVPFEIPPMDFQQLVVNAYKVLNERIETKQKINDNNSKEFVEELKRFFRERIECNRSNMSLKEQENEVFENILYILDDISAMPELRWDYRIPFSGFVKYLREEQIKNYALILDKEGEQNEASRTMQAACEMGLSNVTEENSKDSCGLRMADMMAGIISKLLKALCDELHYHSIAEGTEKKLLSTKWFQLNEAQLNLYKKLYKIICEWDNVWYKSFAGIYSDDLVCFIGLLGYMAHFENTEQLVNEKLEMQGEYFNGYVCRQLSDYFNRRRSKLPIDLIDKNDEEYFLNRRGAKVYFDITKQPILQIAEGSQTEMVLSVGMDKSGSPLITISNDGNPICYRLPEELSDWAYTAIGMANMGENLFPSQVVFTKEKNRYFADVL